jgi:hypothetical protein
VLADSAEHADPEQVLPYAQRLAEAGDEPTGLLAAALVRKCGARAGWPPEWRDLLRRLRDHDAPEFAYAARAAYTVAE